MDQYRDFVFKEPIHDTPREESVEAGSSSQTTSD
jgi:hypothetical protein